MKLAGIGLKLDKTCGCAVALLAIDFLCDRSLHRYKGMLNKAMEKKSVQVC